MPVMSELSHDGDEYRRLKPEAVREIGSIVTEAAVNSTEDPQPVDTTPKVAGIYDIFYHHPRVRKNQGILPRFGGYYEQEAHPAD